MPSIRTLSFVLTCSLLSAGCQSASVVAVPPPKCLPPPVPEAWIMQPVEPTLTQEILQRFSPSPTRGTMPSGN
jgi:hypothetical protein